MPDIETRLQDVERRMSRMIQTGVIVAADYDAARVRVAVDERVSDWLPWATRRAGGDVDWWAPEVGEQVDLLCPNGEMNGARVIPAFYSDAAPAPSNDPDERVIVFGNGTTITHHRKNNTLDLDTPCDVTTTIGGQMTADVSKTVDVTAGGAATLKAPSVTVDSPQSTFTGAVIVQGPLTYQAGMTGTGGAGAAAQIDGAVEATGDVTAAGVSLETHTHPGDSGGTTGGPN